MPLLQSPSPMAPAPRRGASLRAWALALAAAAGGLVLVLAMAGRLAPGPATAAILSLAAVAALVWLVGDVAPRAVPVLAVANVEARSEALPSAALAEVADGLPDPVLVIGGHERDDYADRRILFANRAARELLRLAPDALLLVTAVRNPEVLAVVDEALFGGVEGQADYEAGGVQERFWRAVAKPLSDAADGQRRALLVLRDDTDARRNERMRADFLANASHELRTPLASLAGFIDTLRGHAKEDPAARERFLGIMAAQAWRMARLIEDLMSLSRIELNEHIRPGDVVDLAMAVSDVVDALGPQAHDAGVVFEVHAAPRGAAVVAGDRDQIVQVTQNLVDNAIKYAGRGGKVRVELECGLGVDAATALRKPHASRLSLLTPDHADQRYAVLRVSDSGPGIRREYLPRLTERFYRVEGQKSGERLGTGLGLAIVKHIMNRHQGGLAVESAAGEGASFVVYFPMSAAGVPARPAGAAQSARPDGYPPRSAPAALASEPTRR
jgi:two-component system phosphate regulon sensor histidine kinase PhoR